MKTRDLLNKLTSKEVESWIRTGEGKEKINKITGFSSTIVSCDMETANWKEIYSSELIEGDESKMLWS